MLNVTLHLKLSIAHLFLNLLTLQTTLLKRILDLNNKMIVQIILNHVKTKQY